MTAATEATESPVPADDEAGRVEAAKAVEWLDTALTELEGALKACAEQVEAGRIDPALLSSKIQGLVMTFMGSA